MTKITCKIKLIVLFVSLGLAACSGSDNNSANHSPYSSQIVFVKKVTPTDDPTTWGYSQIYRMAIDGSNLVNLSNRSKDESMPNVSSDSKQIVFIADINNLYVMGVDGSEMKLVPNAPRDAGYPKWSRGIHGSFILYSYPYSSGNSSIYRINPDGSSLSQITHPASNEQDGQAVSIDDQYIVFSRSITNTYPDWRSDLYVKNILDNSPEVLLSSAPTNCLLSLPVVSHNGKKIAYRVRNIITGQDWIHVAEFSGINTITPLRDINLTSPASMGISGIDFSADDQELIISLQANDVSGSDIGRKQEIFRVTLDGSNQRRLTLNSDSDLYPSIIP